MSKSIVIAADISKGYADFLAMSDDKSVVLPPFQLDDCKAGHDQLVKHCKSLQRKHQPHRTLLVVESTGGFEDNWFRLSNRKELNGSVESFRINPKVIHHEYRVQHRNSISDAVSSRTIAEHVVKNLEHYEPRTLVADVNFDAARSLIRHLQKLDKTNTERKNSLQQLLYRYLPSMVNFIPDRWSAYFLTILSNYATKRGLQQAAAQGFKRVARVPKGVAEKIHQALLNGIDPSETPPMVSLTIKSKAAAILHLSAEIADLEKQLCAMAPVDEDQVELLCSIRGMGEVTAVKLLCFIEDSNRFDDASKMAAFFGVQPRVKHSGDGKTTVGMSKQGNAIVRHQLYLLAFRTLSNEPYLRSIYAKARAKGKSHDDALGVLMHKLLRIIFGMLKSGVLYDPGVDQLNQLDPRCKTLKAEVESEVVEQATDESQPEAPISKRERRKRREQKSRTQEFQAAAEAERAESS